MRTSLNEFPTFQTPDWTPRPEQIQASNIGWLMQHLGTQSYAEVHAWTVEHREDYWKLVLERIGVRFRQPFQQLLDLSRGSEHPNWLAGAKLNIAESCFNAPPETIAIIHQVQGGAIQKMTYGELDQLSGLVASNLKRCGFQAGDALAILMPMTAEAVAIYLGIIKVGCVVVGIADSFRVPEIATRLRISSAKAVFTQDVLLRGAKTFPLYVNAVEAGAPVAIVLPAQQQLTVELREQDLSWSDFLRPAEPFDPVATAPNVATNILFSSGTTGEPKAIPWNQTTPIKCAADAHFHQDVQPGDIVVWPTNLGWMMGPWLIFASLMNRATMGIYSGAPTGREFGEFVQNAKATVLGVIPSIVKTWRNTECMTGLDWSSIKLFSSTGECSNADDMRWLMKFAGGKPVIEYCGGTEIGGSYLGQTIARPIIASTFNTPILGWDFVILDENGKPAEQGELFLIPPSIGNSITLLNADHHQIYFAETPPGPGGTLLRRHGDQVQELAGGYWQAQGRADDTMNLGGIKVSSAEIERVLQTVPGVLETAAIAIADQGGPSLLVIYAVVNPSGSRDPAELQTAMQKAISQDLNPLFKIHEVIVVTALPRTASNKVMRRELRKQYRASK
ncbi:AMP-binding protein [Planctomicrobium sp. SH661]|uniref:AMP-binding protein n=1 Tax=Planctomicrobium sp. SH661 TaxID=3448124 RepID=UPI003F5AF729